MKKIFNFMAILIFIGFTEPIIKIGLQFLGLSPTGGLIFLVYFVAFIMGIAWYQNAVKKQNLKRKEQDYEDKLRIRENVKKRFFSGKQ